MSLERAVFFFFQRTSTFNSQIKILDLQTHFKFMETFQYMHLSSCHPFNSKKGFIKREALRLLRTTSVKDIFEKNKRDFEQRLSKKGYPLTLVRKVRAEVKFACRKDTLRNRTKTKKRDSTVCFHLRPRYTESQTRFSWDTGTLFNNNLSSNEYLTSKLLFLIRGKNH